MGRGRYVLICVRVGISWRIRRMTGNWTTMRLPRLRTARARRSCTALPVSPTRTKDRHPAHFHERKPDTLELRTTFTSVIRRRASFRLNEAAVNILEEARVPCSVESLPRRIWTSLPWLRPYIWRSSCRLPLLCRRPSVKLPLESVSRQGRG